MTPDELDAWLLAYVEKEEATFAWDWEADLAFARATKADPDTVGLIHTAVKGMGPATYTAYYMPEWLGIKKARIKALGRLTKTGKLTASWSGIPSSVTGGTTRNRTWTLSGAGR